MCAIFGSSDKEKFLELAELNQYRGKYSNSTSVFVVNRFKSFGDSSAEHLFTQRQLGLFDDKWVKEHNEVNTKGYITYYLGLPRRALATYPSCGMLRRLDVYQTT